MKNSQIGLFGGSFNPPHNGHVSAVTRAMEALALSRMVIMPAGCPPHKDLPPDTPSAEDRLAMARLAFAEVPGCEVSDWEMLSSGPGYTFDTLDWLRGNGFHPTLIVGSDMLLTLHEWHRVDELLAFTRVAALVRAADQETVMRRQAAFLAHRYGAAIDWIDHTPVEISSSEIRTALRRGQGKDHLPEPVAAYIQKKHLYGVTADDA